MLGSGCEIPPIVGHPNAPEPTNALVVVRAKSTGIDTVMLSGDGAHIFLGDHIVLPKAFLHCGTGARLVLEGQLSSGPGAWVDARNGGSVTVGLEALWSVGVRIVTDDMHALIDAASGERLNRWGSDIRIGKHVWLGYEVIVQPGVTIGDDCIVGTRAVVTGDLPRGTLSVGTPARVIREGVSWAFEDRPPS